MSVDPVSLAITAALTAASTALQMSRKIEGPRLTDLTVTVADYGTPIAYFYGERRLECPCFYAEPIKEQKKKRKTKGGKYNEYTYYGTWAVLICGHEISAVTRIWFDRNLIYDLTGGGPNSIFDAESGYDLASSIRIYLGTETQEPDPRMLATVEARDGPDSCPAYLGYAYVMFTDVPLEKLGNRLPQVSIQAIRGEINYGFDVQSANYPPGKSDGNGPVFALNPLTREGVRIKATNTGSSEVYTFEPNSLNYQFEVQGSSGFMGQAFDWKGRVYYSIGSGNSGRLICETTSGTEVWRLGQPANTLGDFTFNSGGDTFVRFVNTGRWTALTAINEPGMPTVVMHWVLNGQVGDGFSLIHADGVSGGDQTGALTESSINAIIEATNSVANYPGGENNFNQVIPDHDRGVFYAVMKTASTFDIWKISFFWSATILHFMEQVGSLSYGSPESLFPAGGSLSGWAVNRATGELVLSNGSSVILWDPATDTVVTERQDIPGFTYGFNYYEGPIFGYISGNNALLVDMPTLDVRMTVTPGEAPELGSYSGCAVWDQEYQGVIFGNVPAINRIHFAMSGSGGTTLRTIVDDVSFKAGLLPADIETSQLTQVILGYSWTQGTCKDIIEPLLDLYDVDPRPHDFVIQFQNRGVAAGGVITTDWFVRRGEEARYTRTNNADTDLPRRLFLNFSDVNADQQVNSAVVQRHIESTDSIRELTIDMTNLVLDPAQAKQLSERLMRRVWLNREEVENAVTAHELALEPADVMTLDLDGRLFSGRLTRQTIGADGVISCTWVRDLADFAVLSESEGAGMDGRVPDEVFIPTPTEGFILDIPLINDEDDSSVPFLYIAGAPNNPNGAWAGADILWSETGDADSYEAGWDGVTTAEAATWGQCTAALGPAVPEVIDNGLGLNVLLKYGSLESITLEAMLASYRANLALVGNEIIQFQTATLETDGSYTLTGLVRGARGTEAETDSHVPGERFLLLSTVGRKHPIGAADIGDTDYYMPVSMGLTAGTGTPVELTFSAAANRPRAVAHLTLEREANDDWTITWMRRTRIGGNLVAGRDVPLGEVSELYEVDILDDGAAVRTIVVTDAEAVYTAAQQIEDFGSEQATLSIVVYQMSPALDLRGYPAAATGG